VIAAGFLVGMGTSYWATTRPDAIRANLFDQVTFNGFPYEARSRQYLKDRKTHPIAGFRDVSGPIPDQPAIEPWVNGGIIKQWAAGNPRVVVFGCSHAQMYAPTVDDVCRQLGVPCSFLCANGTSVFFDGSYSVEFDESRKSWLKQWHPDVVFLMSRWERQRGPLATLEVKVTKLIEEIEPHAGAIVVVTQVPAMSLGESINPREYVREQVVANGRFPKIMPDVNEPFRRSMIPMFQRIAAKHPKVRLVRADEKFHEEDGSVRYASGRSFYYADDGHLTDCGAAILREEFFHIIADACGKWSAVSGLPDGSHSGSVKSR
jgi:hypothetical protein